MVERFLYVMSCNIENRNCKLQDMLYTKSEKIFFLEFFHSHTKLLCGMVETCVSTLSRTQNAEFIVSEDSSANLLFAYSILTSAPFKDTS